MGTCVYCGSESDEMHKDHLIPQSRGGSDEIENCISACAECNMNKSDKTPSEWRSTGLPDWVYEKERTLSQKYKMTSRKSRGGKQVRDVDLGLVGNFFHSWQTIEGNSQPDIKWQGMVLFEVKKGELYMVQLFSWAHGEPYSRELVKVDDMIGWSFYSDAEEMEEGYQSYKRSK